MQLDEMGLAWLALMSCLVACSGEPERALYTGGHADIALELVMQDGRAAWDAYLSARGAIIDGDFVNGAVSLEDIVVSSRARFTRPAEDSGAFHDLCVDGDAEIAWLPQGLRDATDHDSPFLGISATADPTVLDSETVTLRPLRIDSPSGSGAYSLWRDGLPPEFFMSSCDGIDEHDVLDVPLGHDHYNMGFSEVGQWTVSYEVSARLSNGDESATEFRVHYVLE